MKSDLIVRAPSGMSGDMMVTGLAKVGNFSERCLNEMIAQIGVRELCGAIKIRKAFVNGITGWRASVKLKPEHHHRSFKDIQKIIARSRLSLRAKRYAQTAFRLLAKAEGAIHRVHPDEVTFHEIGGLDSILDVCLAAALFDALSPARFFCSPLPLCDGNIPCAHGVLPSPAPAALYLLKDVPVYGIDSKGETVTPTAISLLKAFGAKFGPWPKVSLKNIIRAYGSRVLPNVPNGAVFALGDSLRQKKVVK
ncbi:MAG: DUF111 family protein [Candidatus Omnitrophica bacterium]|nr:DUF111 family protein [Candidatus Omnitrophota bacterium]MDD5671129.1 DUF111 family protein [Candidatus Omnitrophota bacterium]